MKKPCRLALLSVLLCACLLSAIVTGSAESEPVCEIVIENLTLGESMPDLHAVEEAVNAITLPAIHCTVRIENVHIADHVRRMELNRVPENRLDIVNTGRTMSLSQMAAEGILYPLDDLLAQYGPVLREKAAALLPGCRINGSLYCVPSNLYVSAQPGFLYNEELAAACGLVLEEQMTIEDLERIAEILASRGVYLLAQGNTSDTPILLGILYPSVVPVDSNSYVNGVFRDGSWTEVVNVFETEQYLDYCRTLRRWQAKGWMPGDTLVSGLSIQQMFQRGQVFMNWIAVSPVDLAIQRKNYPFEIGMFVTSSEHMLTTGQIHSSGWGVSAESAHPEKAVELLNLIYDNAELANLLMNGIEGRDYVKLSEHIITYPEGVDASNVGYRRRFSGFGDYMDVYQWYPADESFYEELRRFSESQTISPVFGYTFDISPVADACDAVSAVLTEYLPPLESGLIEDVDEAVRNLNEALRLAGIDRIIAENQRQLELWYRDQKA